MSMKNIERERNTSPDLLPLSVRAGVSVEGTASGVRPALRNNIIRFPTVDRLR
jgi:hypothetical protein